MEIKRSSGKKIKFEKVNSKKTSTKKSSKSKETIPKKEVKVKMVEEKKPRDVNEVIQKAADVLQRVGTFEQKRAQQPQQIQVPQVPKQEPKRVEPSPYSYEMYGEGMVGGL